MEKQGSAISGQQLVKIKAISLWQPWASLIAVGAKKYETRSWRTNYQGPLLICASMGGLKRVELKEILRKPKFIEALEPLFDAGIPADEKHAWIPDWFLPQGKAVAIVELIRCVTTEDFKNWIKWNKGDEELEAELPFGDFSNGRFAWELANIRRIKPFYVKGRQGLFDVDIPEELIHEN